jgi:hypothetical protein
MFVGGIVVDDGMDELAGGYGGLDPVEKANEFLVVMACDALAGHRAIQTLSAAKSVVAPCRI